MTKQIQKQKLVYGIGINDLAEPMWEDGKARKFYTTWHAMIRRCYSDKLQARNPTYAWCSICDSWLLLSNFRNWFDINYHEGMELDKDILIPGNKVYSPEACRFVPHHLNSLLTNAAAARGDLPCGVSARKPDVKAGRINTTYRGYCSDSHGGMLHKNFKTIPEAAAWYSMTKKKVVKEIVLESFWRNEIMSDVATALLEREW